MSEIQNEGNIFFQTLEWLCDKLDKLHIPYMITGGSAVGFWGHIRTTMDIDVLIQIRKENITVFLEGIENEAYVNIEEAKKAVSKKESFNIILNKTCFKIDIIPLDDKNEYELEKFKNRIKINFKAMAIFIIRPEDLLISKLLWSKSAGGSERQLKDCESIYRLNRGNLNLEYIEKWVKVLNVEEGFEKIKGETQ